MIRKIFKLSKGQKVTTLIIFMYSVTNALIGDSKIGLLSLIILISYLLLNLHKKNVYKVSFSISLILLIFAVFLYILDVTNTLYIPIKKLSEWAYLILLIGVIQLAWSYKYNKN